MQTPASPSMGDHIPSPDASTAAILGASSTGWSSPQRPSPSRQDMANSTPSATGSPSKLGTAQSRTFDPNTLRSHGYVSNSIFKKLPSAGGNNGSPAGAPPSPSRTAGLGRGGTPLTSPQQQQRMGVGLGIGVNKSANMSSPSRRRAGPQEEVAASRSDAENEDAPMMVASPSSTHPSALAPRKSKGFQVLTKSSYVSNSPFKRPEPAGEAPRSQTRPLSLRSTQQQQSRPADESLSGTSPTKGLLTSNRLHGPRTMASADDSDVTVQQQPYRRERRKTVTFDESPDVQEFDRESSFDGSSLRSGDSTGSLQSQDSPRGTYTSYEDDDEETEARFWTNASQPQHRLMVVNGSSPDPSSSPEVDQHEQQNGTANEPYSSGASSNDDSREMSNSESSDIEPLSPEPNTRSLSTAQSPAHSHYEQSYDEKSYATAADDTLDEGDRSHASLGLGGLQRVDSMVDELLHTDLLLTSPPISDQNTAHSMYAEDAEQSFEQPVRRGGPSRKKGTAAPPKPLPNPHSREASAGSEARDEAAVEQELFQDQQPKTAAAPAESAAPQLAAPADSGLPSLPNWSPLMMDDKSLPPLDSEPPASPVRGNSSPRRPGPGASGRPHISRDAVLERVAREKRAQADAEQRLHAANGRPQSKESPADMSLAAVPASHTHSEMLKGRPSAPAASRNVGSAIRPAQSMSAVATPAGSEAPPPVPIRPAHPEPTPSFEARREPEPTPIKEAPEQVSPLERLGEEMLAQQTVAETARPVAASDELKSPWFGSVSSVKGMESSAGSSSGKRASPPANLTLPSPGLDADAPPSPALSVRSGQLAPSNLGPPPPAVSGDEYAQQIIERRRSKRGGGRRKRSMSTGDAGVSTARAALNSRPRDGDSNEAEDIHEGFEGERDGESEASSQEPQGRASIEADLNRSKLMLDTTVQKAIDGGFGNGLSRDISRIFRDGDSPYKTIDRGVFAGVDDNDKVSHSRAAGDVDSGKAWRKLRRPSDINEYAEEMRAYRAKENPKKAAGKVFVMIDSFHPSNLPVPQTPTRFYSIIDNGLHIVKTGTSLLRPGQDTASPIGLEFELIQHKNLEFNLTLFVQRDAHLQDPRAPSSPTKKEKTGSVTRSFMSKLLRSPKKDKFGGSNSGSRSPERVEPLLSYMNREGAFGRVDLVFEQVASKCLGKCYTIDLPVRGVADQMSSISGQASLNSAYRGQGSEFSRNLGRSRGFMRLKLFYLPPMPSVPPKMHPQNLKECIQGMESAKVQQEEARLSGVLTQQGGDCATWRRRPLKAQGTYLICYNEVTKRPTVKIDLSKATKIEEAWDPYDPKLLSKNKSETEEGSSKPAPRLATRESMVARFNANEEPDESYHVARSFRVTFSDGERISFFADTDEEKDLWIDVMADMIHAKRPAVPMWAQVAQEIVKGVEAAKGSGSRPAMKTMGSASTTKTNASATTSTPSGGGGGGGGGGGSRPSASLSSKAAAVPPTVQEESAPMPAETNAPPSPGKIHRKQVPSVGSSGAIPRVGHHVQSASVSSPAQVRPPVSASGGMGHTRAYSHTNVHTTPARRTGSGMGGVMGTPSMSGSGRPRSELFTPVRKGSVAVPRGA